MFEKINIYSCIKVVLCQKNDLLLLRFIVSQRNGAHEAHFYILKR